MRKKLALLAFALVMFFPFQSFRTLPLKPLTAKTFSKPINRILYKLGTGGGGESVQVQFEVENQVGTIYAIRVFDNSTCEEYSVYGYSGSISYSAGHYIASDVKSNS